MGLIKYRLTFSNILLILVNLIPLFGVWLEGWEAGQVFLIYCLETILIGIVNVFKMVATGAYGMPGSNPKGKYFGTLFIICFFIFHYGFFVLIQTQMFFKLSHVVESQTFFVSYIKIFESLGREGKLLLGIFCLYYTIDFLFNFIGNGSYRNTTVTKLMFQPYVRIFVQQFVVILGGFFLMLKSDSLFIILFILIKIIFEYWAINGKLGNKKMQEKMDAAFD